MTRTFAFRDVDGVLAAAAGLGLALPDPADPRRLLEPLAVGPLRARNRLGVHPMEGCDATAGGAPADLTVRRWTRFAAGGSGTLWGEATAVLPEARANPAQLLLSESTYDAFARLVAATRAADPDGSLVLGLQLTHSGRFSWPESLPARRVPALDGVRGGGAPLLGADDLARAADAFVAAAGLVQRAGFDFVDVKQCHTYLAAELLGASGPLQERLAWVLDVVARIRDTCPGLVLASRVGVYDGFPGGFGGDVLLGGPDALAVPVAVVRSLGAAGVSLVSVTMGSPYLNPHLGRPFEKPPVDAGPAPEHPLAGVARQVAAADVIAAAVPDVTVVGAGWSWLRHLAPPFAAATRSGTLFLGRGAIAYPDFAADLAAGGLRADRTCLTTSQCTALMRAKHNAAGQFPAGCVPRDAPVYRPLYREMIATRDRG